MMKKTLVLPLLSACSISWAANPINLHQAPLSELKQFSFSQQAKTAALPTKNVNNLKKVNQTKQANLVITRYQQLYQGIPIVGAQVTVSQNPKIHGLTSGQVNGHLFNDIQLNTKPTLNSQQALQLAKERYAGKAETSEEKSELQIRTNKDNQLGLTYLVSFKSFLNSKPVWPFFIIDAQTGEILKQWNNIQPYKDSGPGGNEKVHEYWYGKDGLPALDVSQNEQSCTLDDGTVAAVNVNSKWDWQGFIQTAISYPCGNNVENFIHGSYSAENDAYFFGHIILDLYKDWYGLNALQDSLGNPQKLIMRVHFGEYFDNAFWDGKTMTFGDGNYFYPLVSLDVAGHEVSHGFTQQHSNLEYHDESGALNEAFSDMAGQASRAYLLEKYPELYNKAFLTPNEVTWEIGETLIPSSLAIKALRFLDLPSLDKMSADCFDKKMARRQNSLCAISYPELLAYVTATSSDEDDRQSALVHFASGIFNRVFYLMAKQMGIKTAFQVMIIANTKYWTPITDFKEAACGVIDAAKDLNLDTAPIVTAFKKVGISTTHCINV
ncbi:M4 family metallopeptidase [Legionella massiliensis]|uniref:M4 family metallopeptidase n=1 Tax=Legionella massiliensis TaxID=1034943 RepID=UPI0005C6C0BE